MQEVFDVVIIGSGPNGLSAGIALAQKGLKVQIVEASDTVGGGMRTQELTLPGYHHDVCSAVHPMGYLSPFFKTLPLEEHGLEWIIPEASAAQPLDDEEAVLLFRDIDRTADQLGVDQLKYPSLIRYFAEYGADLMKDSFGPLSIPDHPFLLARFGMKALQPATFFTKHAFRGERAKALFAGCTAHSVLPFDKLFTSAIGLMFLVTGHMENWPIPKGGSQSIADALAGYFRKLGGVISLSMRIKTFHELPKAKKYIFDTDPVQLADIAQTELPTGYSKRLKRYNYGPGVFKVDYALDGPIPWKDPRCLMASTVHVGGTFNEVAASEKAAWKGEHHEKPFVMLSQQSQFDDTRAPNGKHTGWAYCHVPYGSDVDMTNAIENQIERFAPGFKDLILARHKMNTKVFYDYNPNYLGGAVTGGAADITQLFTRPLARFDPYSTPNRDIFICSASTPPGGGVHGMGGYHAAQSVLKSLGYQ